MLQSKIFGLSVITSSKKQLLFELEERLLAKSSKRCALICTPNPEQIVLAQQNLTFFKMLAKADYLLPDGIGLVIASRLLKFFGKISISISERIAGVEVVSELLSIANARRLPVLIIGGRSYAQVADFKNLHWIEAYRDKTKVLFNEEQALADKILSLKPAIVFVALGAPEQEAWLMEHRRLLDQTGVKLAMAVGGSFDFIFMKVARAPRALQTLGLEWLWRLIVQPWRWRRQLALLSFAGLVLRETGRSQSAG